MGMEAMQKDGSICSVLSFTLRNCEVRNSARTGNIYSRREGNGGEMPRPVMPYVQKEKTRHGKAVYYFRASKDSNRIRLPDEYRSPAFFKAYGLAMEGISSVQRLPAGVTQRVERRIREALSRCVSSAADRAKEKNLAFDINLDWITAQALRQGCRCALTNIPFYFKATPALRNPMRRRSTESIAALATRATMCASSPYAINVMLWDWGEDVFSHIAVSYNTNKKRNSIPVRGIIATPLQRTKSNEINDKKNIWCPGEDCARQAKNSAKSKCSEPSV
jgi:hypothetical protein